MAGRPKTPTSSKDVDIFGKDMLLSDAERHIIGGDHDIFLRKILHVDTHSKKGDPMEPKTLVISSSRCFILTQKGGVKLEASFNFLKIQQLDCTESKLTFHLAGEPRPREFNSEKKDSIEILGLITAQFKSVFPVTPLEMIIRINFSPEAMKQDVLKLRDNMLSMMEQVDASSIHGFITAYGFLCDFFGVTFSEEISWYLKNIYHAHGFRDLKLADFDHLSSRDLLPVLSTLRHNQFFEGIIEKDGKMVLELFEELGFILNSSRSLKKLVLNNCGMKPENMIRLSTAIKNNPKSVITHLDLSDNLLDDKAVESLGLALEHLPHGLQELVLANCKITPRAGSQLAQLMKQNKNMQYSLVHYDLSGNPLGPDPQGALAFIQDPQTIARLNLSKCGLSFDQVIPLLNRGCRQHLRELDLSQNAGRMKKVIHGSNIGPGLQQFCSSAIAIQTINLSDCKLNSDVVSAMLEGLAINPNVQAIDLNLASNDLGVGRDPHNLPTVLARTRCLGRIDISACGLDNIIPDFVDAVAANKSIKHLAIGRNFNSRGNVRAAALESLAGLLSRDSTRLESLCLSESRLKEQTAIILDALASSRSLTTLDVSGNQMMNRGARCLAKALLSNCRLREVTWDHNETTLYGFQDVANALEHNYTLRAMPLPLHDIGRMGRGLGVEAAVQRIQVYLCRNHSDERVKIELAARHRRRLLTATQQTAVIGRETVQLGDLLEWAGTHGHAQHEDVVVAREIKEQANKVVQLVDSLYSTHVESEQFETITAQVRSLMDSFMDDLYREHVQENSEKMVSQSEKACPTVLTDEARESLKKLVVGEMGSEYVDAKKAVAHKAAPEIINHISGINLDIAADISELIVEQTLDKLEKCNAKLFKLQKKVATSGAAPAPDQRVSKNFTFRVKGEDSPRTKKKRSRKPDPEDEEEIDIPDAPLDTEGPVLHHPGKSRPKPARMQRGGGGRRGSTRPAHLGVATDETDSSKTEEAPVREEAVEGEKPKTPLLPKKPVEKAEEPVKPDQLDQLPERPPKPVTPVQEQNGPAEVVQPQAVKELPSVSPRASKRASLTPSPQSPSPLPDVTTSPTPSTEEALRSKEQSPAPEEPLVSESADKKSPPPEEVTPTEDATPSKKDKKKTKKEKKQPETSDQDGTLKSKKATKEAKKEKKQQEKVNKQEKLDKQDKAEKSEAGSRPETPDQDGTLREKKKTTTRDRKRGGLSKIFGRSKSKDEVEEIEKKEVLPEVVGEEVTPPTKKPVTTPPTEKPSTAEPPEVQRTPEAARKPPPPVKSKPKRSASTEFILREEGGGEGEVEEGRRLPVGATAQIGQLASVLKTGIGVSPLKPRPPVDKPADEGSDSPQQGKRPTPSPKPRGSIPLSEDSSEPLQQKPSPTPKPRGPIPVSEDGRESPQQKPSPGPKPRQQPAEVQSGKDSPQPGQKPSPAPRPRPKPRPRKANTTDLSELLKESDSSPPVERKPTEDGPPETKPTEDSSPETKPTPQEDKPSKEIPQEDKPSKETPPEDVDAPPRPPPPVMDTSDEEEEHVAAPEDKGKAAEEETVPVKAEGDSMEQAPSPSANETGGGVPSEDEEDEEGGMGPSIISLEDDGSLSSGMDTLV